MTQGVTALLPEGQHIRISEEETDYGKRIP